MSSNVYTSDVTVDSANKSQLEESIRLRKQRLAANIDEFVGRVHPKALTRRATDNAKSVVINDDGSVKADRIALIGGAVLASAALVTLLVLRAKR